MVKLQYTHTAQGDEHALRNRKSETVIKKVSLEKLKTAKNTKKTVAHDLTKSEKTVNCWSGEHEAAWKYWKLARVISMFPVRFLKPWHVISRRPRDTIT